MIPPVIAPPFVPISPLPEEGGVGLAQAAADADWPRGQPANGSVTAGSEGGKGEGEAKSATRAQGRQGRAKLGQMVMRRGLRMKGPWGRGRKADFHEASDTPKGAKQGAKCAKCD
jgi:hypothetical protein